MLNINKDYNNIKSFVINLDDYKENFVKQLPFLQNVGLNPERFSGINALKDEHLDNKYNKYISNLIKQFTPKSIIGCSLSHILCCKYIFDNYFDNNVYDFYLILEDDCYPLFDKKEFYERLMFSFNEINILDKDWEIIQLHSDAFYPTTNTYVPHYVSGSTAAYLISKKGIEKMIKQKVSNHIDFITQNFIKFKKYRVKHNLFKTDENESLNRNKLTKYEYYSLKIKSYVLFILNKYFNILPLRGDKSYSNFLEFKVIKMPFINKDYTANNLIDYLSCLYLLKKFNNYLKK